jgi:hypothetical protein
MVLRVIGYRSVHQTAVWKCVLAVVAPIGVCCGLYFLLILGAQFLPSRPG